MRFFIDISFDGTDYSGWQRQPNTPSVQQTLEEALTTILRQPVGVVGAGRTDAGVHARRMIAHFDITWGTSAGETMLAADGNLTYRLNRLLPNDIAVRSITPVADDKHARFSALSRTYHYYIHTEKEPFLRRYSTETHYLLNFTKMNEAASLLLRHDNFQAFSKTHTDVKTFICHLSEAHWYDIAGNRWVFVITSDRFLRNMVRAIVGTLFEIGRGRMTIDGLEQLIEGRRRCDAGDSVPARGLFLWDIKY